MEEQDKEIPKEENQNSDKEISKEENQDISDNLGLEEIKSKISELPLSFLIDYYKNNKIKLSEEASKFLEEEIANKINQEADKAGIQLNNTNSLKGISFNYSMIIILLIVFILLVFGAKYITEKHFNFSNQPNSQIQIEP